MHLLTICCTIMLSFSRPLVGYSAETYESFHAVFDPEYYYEQNPDLQEILGNSGENLFQHFITMGVREGRLGRENFNLKAYVFYNPDLLDTYKTDLLGYCRHYMTVGMAEGRICMPQEEGDNKIGEYTTHYNATIPRAINVELAAQRINGCVLQPGELFSFSDTAKWLCDGSSNWEIRVWRWNLSGFFHPICCYVPCIDTSNGAPPSFVRGILFACGFGCYDF